MRFFMFLPLLKEIALLLPTQSALFTPPAAPVRRQLLQLGLGLSSIFCFCNAPALANSVSLDLPSEEASSNASFSGDLSTAAPLPAIIEPSVALNNSLSTSELGHPERSLNNDATAADFGLLNSAAKAGKDLVEAQATVDRELPDFLSEALAQSGSGQSSGEKLDDDLGILRVRQLRSRTDEELGILRLLQTAQATPPPPPKQPTAFLTGRLGVFSSENAFRSDPRLDEQIYQSGLSLYLFPKLSDNTSLYAIAETNLARYENFDSVNYNEIELQLGIRQRLLPRTFAQIGWRNQRLYSPGFRDKLFSVNAIDTLISHRSILNSRMWLDSFYQVRLGFANPDSASRFRQTLTLSLNYGISRSLRTGLLYQLDFDDYTQVSRFDTYQQVLGIVSYSITPESRISVFGGTRFGRSSSPGVSLDDTFYGAGLNVSVPLF